MSEFYNGETLGQRIFRLRTERGLTRKAVSSVLNVSGQLVEKWEKDMRSVGMEYIDGLCSVLGVTVSELLRGKKEENQIVCSDLGLSDDAVSYLRNLNRNRDVSFLSPFYSVDFGGGMAEPENASNNLILKTLDLILSTNCGGSLLQTIGDYVFADYDHGFALLDDDSKLSEDEKIPKDEMNNPIPLDAVLFRVSGEREPIRVSPDVMRFALMQSIQKSVNDLRENAKGEQENEKGKR